MSISEERWHTQAAGQVVIVTGGGGVIGSAIGAAFGRAGARVAIADVSPDLLADAVASIEQAGGRALGFHVDVTDRAAVEQLVTQVEHELGPVDLLINNAARLGAIGPFWEVDPDDWWRTLEVNLRGTMLCSRAVLPGMVERRRGRIINLSSGSVLGPVQYFSAYPVSKTAITRLTEHLAADTREYGISIFAITPGLVYSPSARETFESPSGRKWIGQYEEVYAARHVPQNWLSSAVWRWPAVWPTASPVATSSSLTTSTISSCGQKKSRPRDSTRCESKAKMPPPRRRAWHDIPAKHWPGVMSICHEWLRRWQSIAADNADRGGQRADHAHLQ